ncbi:MAG: hypothetical protein C4567_05385 [Deltaproteobacteria bacterium]|nr:MAG: hypothetical protein C4567_05385 [Deltaproteobacteria bacterium]
MLKTTLDRPNVTGKTPKNGNPEILGDRVEDIVKEFVNTEGSINRYDLQALFGQPVKGLVAHELFKITINFGENSVRPR